MKKAHGTMLALATLTVLIAGSAATHAQGEGASSFPDYYNYVGRNPGMGPKCPPMQYHVVAKNRNQLEGTAFTTGEKGMEIYVVSGALGADGKVTMDLKPVGVGTPARVEGTYKIGMLMLKTVGGSCHVDEFMMMPVVPPQTTPLKGGGG